MVGQRRSSCEQEVPVAAPEPLNGTAPAQRFRAISNSAWRRWILLFVIGETLISGHYSSAQISLFKLWHCFKLEFVFCNSSLRHVGH